jgi:cell division protein FtsL
MSLAFLFEKRFRGFRVIEIAAFCCLTVLVFGTYFSKAHAGRESAEITDVDKEIFDTQRHVRLLQAEVAHLESPVRIETLSEQYLNLAPISAKHETQDTGLMEVARAASDAAPEAKGKPAGSTAPVQPLQAKVVKTASAAPVRTAGAPL